MCGSTTVSISEDSRHMLYASSSNAEALVVELPHCRLGDGRSSAEDAAAAMHACIAASDRQIAQDASDRNKQQPPQRAQQQTARLLLDAGQVPTLCFVLRVPLHPAAMPASHVGQRCCWHVVQPMLAPPCSDDTAFLLLTTATKCWSNRLRCCESSRRR